jgi:hypothetical protein
MKPLKTIKANWDTNTNISSTVIDQAAKNMADDIDFEILMDILCSGKNKWTKVVLKPMTWEDGLEIDGWVEQNVKGKYRNRGLVWIFENASDANWFIIRWN